jgi:hypothetical protein
MKKEYRYNGQTFEWDALTHKCPLCKAFVMIAKQKPEEGCIKVRYFKCVSCEFDSRKFE